MMNGNVEEKRERRNTEKMMMRERKPRNRNGVMAPQRRMCQMRPWMWSRVLQVVMMKMTMMKCYMFEVLPLSCAVTITHPLMVIMMNHLPLWNLVDLLKILMIHTVTTLTTKGKILCSLSVEKKKVPKEVIVEENDDSKVVVVAEAFKTKGNKLDVKMQQETKEKGWETNASNRGHPF